MSSNNPILESKRTIFSYSLLWILFGIIHVGLLIQYSNLPFYIILPDGIIHILTFALLGIGVWYIVQYNTLQAKDLYGIIINHLAAASVVIVIWLGVGFGLMSILITGMDLYEEYFMMALTWRVGMGFVYYSLISMVYYMLLYSKKLQERNIEQISLVNLVKEAELNMLKWQLNPHFLFNSLNSISSLTLSEPEKAHEMIILLSDFLRYSLSFSKNEETQLKKELENIESYLEIEKIRFGDKLQTSFSVEKNALSLNIPNLLLQPLYENAIKYGVQDSNNVVNIATIAKVIDNELHVSVCNPFEKESQSRKGNGVGLRNISDRLNLMYGQKATIISKAEDNIFCVNIIIPQKSIK